MKKNVVDSIVIANNVRAERNRVNMTQEETARFLEITTRTYIDYEKGKRKIFATDLYKLSVLFGCPIASFYLLNNSTKCE